MIIWMESVTRKHIQKMNLELPAPVRIGPFELFVIRINIIEMKYKFFADTKQLCQTTESHEDAEFEKLFAEYKHRYDMSCDMCPSVFESVEEARKHYATEHESSKGHIKCCNIKQRCRSEIKRHLNRHLNSDMYKYVFV